jgi:hypothetical protein
LKVRLRQKLAITALRSGGEDLRKRGIKYSFGLGGAAKLYNYQMAKFGLDNLSTLFSQFSVNLLGKVTNQIATDSVSEKSSKKPDSISGQ